MQPEYVVKFENEIGWLCTMTCFAQEIALEFIKNCRRQGRLAYMLPPDSGNRHCC